MSGDDFVHQRLRERRLIRFVVAVTPVPHEVDEEILIEPLTVGDAEAHGLNARFGIVGVDVDDRDLEPLRRIAGVVGRARVDRVGRESNLIVADDVQRAADAIPAQQRHVERFWNDALAGKRRVAVHDDRQRRRLETRVRRAADHALARARDAGHDRIHKLEMARIRHELESNWARARHRALAAIALVVLHVARVAVGVGRGVPTLELLEQSAIRLSHHMRQHVEPAAVRHANHDHLRAGAHAARDRLVEHRNEGIEAFDREPLHVDVSAAEETLEAIDLGETLKQRLLLVVGQRRRCATRFDRRAKPVAFRVFAQVLELVRQRAAVVVAHRLNDVGGCAVGVGAKNGTRQLSQVGVGDAVEFRLELHRARRRTPERIERNRQVTEFLDRGKQFRGAGGFAEKGRVGRAGGAGAAGDLLSDTKELAPGFVDGGGIATVRLVHARDVAVVEDAGER